MIQLEQGGHHERRCRSARLFDRIPKIDLSKCLLWPNEIGHWELIVFLCLDRSERFLFTDIPIQCYDNYLQSLMIINLISCYVLKLINLSSLILICTQMRFVRTFVSESEERRVAAAVTETAVVLSLSLAVLLMLI